MRVFLTALLALVLISGMAGAILTALQPDAAEQFRSQTGSVRY